ncbi:hypothetical protein [Streptomyces sp. NPDC047014]|uniref:hypothetical protein n=1 Tax=Streptomyces sp. NPDC047014 TaxID=3155736 RepID=UPI0033F99C95
MTPRTRSCRLPYGRPRAGPARSAGLLALLAALAAGCAPATAPDRGYPELGRTLGALSRALEDGCDTTRPAGCAQELDRLRAISDRAFAQVLHHRLLDPRYLDAREALHRARETRLAAAREARARRDPRHPPLWRAVAAERRAYRELLTALEATRSTPPPGQGTDPV